MYDPSLIRTAADIPGVQARLRPDEAAFWFEGRTTTFAEVETISNRCAQALIAAGVQPGERVAVLAKNNDAFFPLWLGCAKARACLAPVNFRLAPPEIAFILRDSGARVLIVGEDFADVVGAVVGDVPGLIQLVQVEEGHPRWPSFHGWIGEHADTDPKLPVEPSDDLIQLYTSGRRAAQGRDADPRQLPGAVRGARSRRSGATSRRARRA
jgi:acyl-CoA synthetase (AMP-forming)/AMP-acid ligase II